MVEHNLSMSLNHHVPIFKRTPPGVGGGGGGVHVGSQTSPPPPPVTSPVLGSCDLALWTTGTFLDGGSLCLSAYTTDPPRLRQRSTLPHHPTPPSDLFLPGRNVFLFCFFCSYTDRRFFSRFPWSEINLSITHECKRLFIKWLEGESSALLFPQVSLCTPPALPEEMQCMFVFVFFGLMNSSNHRVNFSVWRIIKMIWMEMN